MNKQDPFGFAALEAETIHEFNATKPARRETKEQHACEHCGGSGTWRGGRNRHGESKCYACNGKGYFMTSAVDRQRARTKRRESKARKIADAQAAFEEQHPGLIAELRAIADWNSFARDLIDRAYGQYGGLTDGQVDGARKMLAKVAQRRAERAAKVEADSVTVDLSPIRAIFDAAVASGLKRPTYRAEGLMISRAPDTGRNAGSLYVKALELGEYQGKIDESHVYRPAYAAHDETKAALQRIAENPEEAAIRYGRKSGNCSCCGRELTAKESVERGIGPICATKFGM